MWNFVEFCQSFDVCWSLTGLSFSPQFSLTVNECLPGGPAVISSHLIRGGVFLRPRLLVYPDCAPCDSILPLYLCWFFVVQKPFGFEMEFAQLRVSTVKTTETIESLTQQELLYTNLKNVAGNQRGEPGMSMLDDVAAEAAALAEMQTQVVEIPTIVASMEVETVPMAGHIAKRSKVAMGADGGPAGCPKVVDDCENMEDEDEIPGCASDDRMGRMDRTQLTGSDPHVSWTANIIRCYGVLPY